MTASSAKPGPKPMLTREAVIEAGLGLIDREGLGALNLRRLARELGVSAMTPYSYFADKSDLVAAMMSHALSALDSDLDPELQWDVQLDSAMRDLHTTLKTHPGVIELIMAESDVAGLNEFRQRLYTTLSHAGFTRSQAGDVLRTLTSFIFGWSMLTRLQGPASERRRSADSFQHGLSMIMDAVRVQAEAAGGGAPQA